MNQPAFHFHAAIDRQFREFHAANPHVYQKLREIALFVRARGHRRFGVKALFERLRWISLFETTGDPYRLNNNYTAYYARLLMAREPALAGLFELRASRADRRTT